jgi:hypothetical protein
MESKQEFPTFCYNVKMIPSAQGGNTVNLAQIDDSNKTIQYITQPFTTSYGQSYTLVNPVQLAGQNGQIVINNKPLTSVSSKQSPLRDFFLPSTACFSPSLFRTQYPTSASNVTCAVKYSRI